MKKVENFHNIYDGDLYRYIFMLERKYGINGSDYIIRMRKMLNALIDYDMNMDIKNYATHTPFLVNKKDMLETFQQFPDIIMYRCLYGNFKKIGGKNGEDHKVLRRDIDKINCMYLSTSDYSFKHMNVGKLIREAFPEASKYER